MFSGCYSLLHFGKITKRYKSDIIKKDIMLSESNSSLNDEKKSEKSIKCNEDIEGEKNKSYEVKKIPPLKLDINFLNNNQINNPDYFEDQLLLENINKMNYIFDGCESLSFIPDISNWKTSKVTKMNNIFSGCKSLILLPDISKWNTQNVTDFSHLFWGCSNLQSLPDISNWNTQNVTDFSYLFGSCFFLKSLPDISKWNTSKMINVNGMFNKLQFIKFNT